MLKWALKGKPKEFRKRDLGSDPRSATCRSKLQNKRSKLNQEINKEMMLRAGAENLYNAIDNKKLKETVALELSFVNSNLQLLKEQLAELNSSVDIYQSDGSSTEIPMIPLGLKETKEIDIREPFKDFILEHYSEDCHHYEDSIQEFMDVRQAIRTPRRDDSGVALLFEYFNQLYYVERRFFPPDRSLGIYFEWYDSLTGIPNCQRTVAFEKASVLFNIGALYTQIGARQDRSTSEGLDGAVDNFLRSAGTFKYIHENFTNAPAMDLGPEMLEMLVHLMLAQAQECLFNKLIMTTSHEPDIDLCLEIAQEAAEVSEMYEKVHQYIVADAVKDYIPYSWLSLALVKREHYRALSHYHLSIGLLDHTGHIGDATRDTLQFIQIDDKQRQGTMTEIRVPVDATEQKTLGKSHLREAVLLHEEALRLHRLCRQFKKQDLLHDVLRSAHDRSFNKYSSIEEEDDFREVLDPPRVQAASKYQLSLTPPDFSQHKVDDLFHDLGPVAIFSAKHHWSAPRTVELRKRQDEGFGFSVRGDAPVIIAGVDTGSLADLCGMREGDFIVGTADRDTKWAPHDDVVALIKSAADNLTLRLVTPMDRNYLKQPKNGTASSKGSISPGSTTSSSSGISSAGSPTGSLVSWRSKDAQKKTWSPFKKEKRKDSEGLYEHNVILR